MNNAIFYFFYSFAHQSIAIDKVIIFFAVYFPYIVIVLAAIFLLSHHEVLSSPSPLNEFKKKWKEILIVFISGIFAWILTDIFKLFFHTARPFGSLSQVYPLFSPTDYAFPSGHAAFFFTVAFSIFFSHRRAGYVFLGFALIISLARITAGVHFPSDILGGLLLGFMISLGLKHFNKI